MRGMEPLAEPNCNVLRDIRAHFAASRMGAPPVAARRTRAPGHKRFTFHARLRSSLGRGGRLAMFWLLILLLKILFDTFVLLPSVAGISRESLCALPFAHGRNLGALAPWISSTVPVPPLTREELVEESVRLKPDVVGADSTHSNLHAMFVQQVACPALVGSLWTITVLMSLASTYVSYIVVVALTGLVVPSLFDHSARWQRGTLVVCFVALWTALMVSLALGALWACMGLLALLAAGQLMLGRAFNGGGFSSLGRGTAGLADLRGHLLKHQRTQPPPPSPPHPPTEDCKKDNGAPSLSAPGAPSSTTTTSNALAVAPSSPSASLVEGLRCSLQILFHRPLTAAHALVTWSALVSSFRAEDLVSDAEASSTLDPLSAPLAFLSARVPLRSEVMRERLCNFFETLSELQRKSSALRNPGANNEDDDYSARFPCALPSQKSLTTLIPLYNETVFYTLEELLAPQAPPPPIGEISSTAAAESPERHITLLQFLVAKHADEFNNLLERILRGEKGAMLRELLNTVRGGTNSAELTDEAQRAASSGLTADSHLAVELLLDRSARSAKTTARLLAARHTLVEEVVVWCSLRGQTVARTVRGLLYTRRAVEIAARFELDVTKCGGQQAAAASAPLSAELMEQTIQQFLHSKFQLLVAAQVYGLRQAGRVNRTHLQQLARLHAQQSSTAAPDGSTSSASSASKPVLQLPLRPQPQCLELVYNFDVRRDLDECVELRRRLLAHCCSVDAAGLSPSEQLSTAKRLCTEVQEPLGPCHFTPTTLPAVAPSSAATTALVSPTVLSALAGLQRRFAAHMEKFMVLRSLMSEARSGALGRQQSQGKVPPPADKSNADSALEAKDAAAPVAARSALGAQDELALHSAGLQNWLETLRFLRHEAASHARALTSSSDSSAAAVGLFVSFCGRVDECVAQLQQLDQLCLCGAATLVQHSVLRAHADRWFEVHQEVALATHKRSIQLESLLQGHAGAASPRRQHAREDPLLRMELLEQMLTGLSKEKEHMLQLQRQVVAWLQEELLGIHIAQLDALRDGSSPSRQRVSASAGPSSTPQHEQLLHLLQSVDQAMSKRLEVECANKQLTIVLAVLRARQTTPKRRAVAEHDEGQTTAQLAALLFSRADMDRLNIQPAATSPAKLLTFLVQHEEKRARPALVQAQKHETVACDKLLSFADGIGDEKPAVPSVAAAASTPVASVEADGLLAVASAVLALHHRTFQQAIASAQAHLQSSGAPLPAPQLPENAPDAQSVVTIAATLRGMLRELNEHHVQQLHAHLSFLAHNVSVRQDLLVEQAQVAQREAQEALAAINGQRQNLSPVVLSNKAAELRRASWPLILSPNSAAQALRQASIAPAAATSKSKPAIASAVSSLLSSLASSYEILVVHGFFSVHCCLDTTALDNAGQGSCMRVLHALPRHRNLVLGCVPALAKLPAPPPMPTTSAKSENQAHALPFARGEVMQTIGQNSTGLPRIETMLL
jgi:hypothetical protein